MDEEITLGPTSLMLNPSFPFMLLMQRVGEEDVSRCVGVENDSRGMIQGGNQGLVLRFRWKKLSSSKEMEDDER